jgi:hypothetical protein
MEPWLQGMNRYAWRILANSSLSLIESRRNHDVYWEASVQAYINARLTRIISAQVKVLRCTASIVVSPTRNHQTEK